MYYWPESCKFAKLHEIQWILEVHRFGAEVYKNVTLKICTNLSEKTKNPYWNNNLRGLKPKYKKYDMYYSL